MYTSLKDWRWRAVAVVVGLLQVIAAAQNGDSSNKAAEQAVDAPTKKLLAAHGLFQRGLYKLAGAEYADFLSEYPKHAQRTPALYALSICQYRQNEFDEAATLLSGVLKDAAFVQRAEALAVLGHCQLAKKDYAKAIAAFDELLARHSKSPHAEAAAMNRGQALYLSGKHALAEEACAAFARDYAKSAQRPMALYFLALAQRAQQKNAEVIATAEQLTKDTAASRYAMDAMLLAGQASEALGKLDEALAWYQRMTAAAPAERKADAYYSLGVCLYKTAKYDDAIKALSKVEAGPYAKPAKLQLGLSHLAANRIPEARAALRGVEDDENLAAASRYGLARCDMADKRFDTARETLGRLLSGKPANAAQIAVDRAICLMELGKLDEAAAEFEAVATDHVKSPQAAESLYRQAFCLHKLKQFDKSHAICERLGKTHSPYTAAITELNAENLFALAKYPEAGVAFENLSRESTDEQRALRMKLRIGQCAYFAGDYAKAVDLLAPLANDQRASAVAELQPAIFLMGDALLQQGKNAEAAAALAKYVAVAKGDQHEAQFKLALARLRNNETEAAEKTLSDLARGSNESPWVQRGLVEYGQLLIKSGKSAQAAAMLKRLNNAPADLAAPAAYLLGWADFDAKKYEQAADRWKLLMETHPKHALAVEAAYQRGVALKEAGKNEQAAAALQEFATAHPRSENAAKARQLAAACLAATGKSDQATEMLASLAISPKASDTVLYDLAWAQRAEKKTTAAAETYRRILKDHPQSKLIPAVRMELAEFLYNDKKFDEAAALLESALATDPLDPKIRAAAAYRLGWCYQKLSKPDKAAEAFAKFDPKHAADDTVAASAILQAGLAHAERGRFDQAETMLSRMLKEYPKDSQAAVAMLKLGEVQAELGKYDESARSYATYLEKNAKGEFAGRAHFGIGWASENRKKYDEARAAYKKAIAADNGEIAARSQFQIGETLLAEGKFEQAIPALLAVEDVYAYPKWSARAMVEAGRAFEEMKQPAEAKKQYETVVSKYKDAPEAKLAQERLKAIK